MLSPRKLLLEKLVVEHRTGELQFFGKHTSLADSQAFAAYLAPPRRVCRARSRQKWPP
jgi:hypothetical protein